MPRGLPDYYNPDTVVAQRLVDLGQLLTGTVGLATIDNKGRLVWFDNFREGVSAWTLYFTGDGAYPQASTKYALVPPCSALLNPAVTANPGTSTMAHHEYLFDTARLGLEWSRKLGDFDCDLDVRLYYDNGSALYYGRVAYFKSDHGIYILDGATSRNIATVPWDTTYLPWLKMKVVIDVRNLTYSHLLIGSDRYDLSSYSLASVAEANPGICRIWITAQQTISAAATCYIGHVFLTTDEP